MSISENKRKQIDSELKQYGFDHGFILLDDYTNARTKIKCECIKNHHIFYKEPTNLKRAKGCPDCIRDEWEIRMNKKLPCVYDTHPDIAKCLKNQEDGYIYSHGSGKEFTFICPVCGNEIVATMNYATTQGLSCGVCGGGKSYPNKIMYILLTQLGVSFIDEYSDDWTDGKYYDFYFCLGDRKYIVEMDGQFHYNDVFSSLGSQKSIDDYKDYLAKSQNICLIRIDCNYPNIKNRYDYIRTNILNSKLSEIFDLSAVNFKECDFYARMPMVKVLADFWNKNIRTLESLSELAGCNKDLASTLLKKASDFGLINESRDDVHTILCQNGYKIAKEKQISIKLTKGRPIKIIQTNEVFRSPAEAKRQYPELKSIYDNLKGTVHYAGEIDGQKICVKYISTQDYMNQSTGANSPRLCILRKEK